MGRRCSGRKPTEAAAFSSPGRPERRRAAWLRSLPTRSAGGREMPLLCLRRIPKSDYPEYAVHRNRSGTEGIDLISLWRPMIDDDDFRPTLLARCISRPLFALQIIDQPGEQVITLFTNLTSFGATSLEHTDLAISSLMTHGFACRGWKKNGRF